MNDLQLPIYRLSLLGRFELTNPDGCVGIASKKGVGLLAFLASRLHEPQQRETIATLLWDSHLDAQARQNLRQTLFVLRRALGRDALISEGEKIYLAPEFFDCDVSRLEALLLEGSRPSLAAGVKLYQGPFLADVYFTGEAWSEWLVAVRQRLEELALDAMVRLSELEMDAGNYDTALGAANRAIAVSPLREDAHRLANTSVDGRWAPGRRIEVL